MINYANMVANITTIRNKPKNVLEIGSRDGKDAEKLRKVFKLPRDKVYIVEPNPDQVSAIRKNFPEATVFEFAVSNKSGKPSFNKVKQEFGQILVGISSLMKRPSLYHDKVEKDDITINFKGAEPMGCNPVTQLITTT